jgi:hypothetical protein
MNFLTYTMFFALGFALAAFITIPEEELEPECPYSGPTIYIRG